MIQEDRDSLLLLKDTNLVVEAGAGTGKTSSLIDRLCICILVHQIPVERLVALTFTEKAAAEIKTRLIVRLQNLIREMQGEQTADTRTVAFASFLRQHFKIKEDPGEEKKEWVSRAEKVLLRLDRVSIGTIHSFCAEILKVFPLEAGLPPNVVIDEGTQGSHLFETRWNKFLDEELGTQAPHKEMWKAVLAEVTLDEMADFARELCKGKIEKYDYYEHASLLLSVCHNQKARAEELSHAYLPKENAKPRALEKALQWAAVSLARTEAFLRGETVPPETEMMPTSDPSRPVHWEEEAYEEALNIYQFAAKVTPEKQRIFLQAYQLISPVCQQIRQDYKETGLVSFDDLIVKTRNLLRDNLYVRRLLKEKFDALLIDEFQDTDPVQGEILLFLAEEKPLAAPRWQEVKLLPGKLFIVGDPKQSIYRFRGADITAYELFTDLILRQGGKKFFLQYNHRSTPQIIATANHICARAMVQQSAFQPAYVPIEATRPSLNNSVEWLFVTAGPENLKADDFRQNQAEQIALWIKNNVGKMTLSNGKKLAYKDIALLFKAATYVSYYTDAFRRHGISFTVEMDKNFFRKQEINDFLNLLQAVSDPSNKIALAGVLRSPLVGMKDEELYQLAQRKELFWGAQTQSPKARYGYALIKKYRSLAGRISTQELVRRILEETFLPEVCAAAYDGPRSVAYLEQLVKWVDMYGAQETQDASSFFARLQEKAQQNPEALHLSSPDETLDAVSILTVHKSKGLEFPVVILTDLTRQGSHGGASKSHIFSWQYNMHGLRVGKIVDVNLAFLEEEQKKHAKCEEVRILYVALTRAKEKLLLVGDERLRGEKGAAPFRQVGLFPDGETKPACLTREEVSIPVTYAVGLLPDHFKYQTYLNGPCAAARPVSLAPWKEAFQARAQRYAQLKEKKAIAPSQQEESELLSPAQQQAAQLGTLCHRCLELLITQREITVQEAVYKAAQEQGAAARAEEAQAIVAPFVQSALFQKIKSCRLLSCELPFSYVIREGEVVSGLIDALVERPDGSLWVLDYKTDRVHPGDEPKLLNEKYASQLRAYQGAVEKLFPGKTVTASCIFVRTFAAADLEKLQ